MVLSLQRYSFSMEYHKGLSLHIADSLLRAPLPMKSQRQVHDSMIPHWARIHLPWPVWHLAKQHDRLKHWTGTNRLSSFHWPKPAQYQGSSVPALVHPYWTIRHELTLHERLLFKQDNTVYYHPSFSLSEDTPQASCWRPVSQDIF